MSTLHSNVLVASSHKAQRIHNEFTPAIGKHSLRPRAKQMNALEETCRSKGKQSKTGSKACIRAAEPFFSSVNVEKVSKKHGMVTRSQARNQSNSKTPASTRAEESKPVKVAGKKRSGKFSTLM